MIEKPTFEEMQKASDVMIRALGTDDDFRDGMRASIASALREHNLPFMPEEELAEHIIKRIVGDE